MIKKIDKEREKLAKIYEDTLAKAKKMKPARTREFDFLDSSFPTKDCTLEVKVINIDSVSEIVNQSREGRTCVINMASFKRPGGGVVDGTKAQEECLFRCSNLGTSISKRFYPLGTETALYTEGATFFKDVNYVDMTPVKCDVITIAAFNISKGNKPYRYNELTKEKIRLMLSIPQKYGVKRLVLGAWGCGVFKNDPKVIAEMFRDLIYEDHYGSYYTEIVFAIFNDKNSVGDNYTIFKNVLEDNA